MSPTTPAHLGILLMRNAHDRTIHGYGRHRDSSKGIDFDWQLLEVPRLPESMLIHAAGCLRYLFKTHNRHGAFLLYIDNTPVGHRWTMVFPPQSCDPRGCDPRLELRNLGLPASARLAGMIASASVEFPDSELPMLPGDGLYIVIDISSEWLVARSTMTIDGQVEGVLLWDVLKPEFLDREEIDRQIMWRPAE